MNKTTNIILSTACFLILSVIAVRSAFADNLTDKYVYSLFNENFNGATQQAGTVNDNIKFNVWANGDSIPTADIISDTTTASAKEGNKYYSCSAVGSTASGAYSGFCYTFITGAAETEIRRDISAFSTLEFYIRPKTGDVSNILVGITDSVDRTVSLSSLGVNNSSHTWQKCTVNLTSLPSVNLTNVKNTFLVITSKQTATFDLDSIVLKRSSSGAFDASLKNISDNLAASSITWTNAVLGTSWTAADQYIELSLDKLETDTWNVKIYTNNGADSKNGLVNISDETKVLPVCWRISKNTLPNSDGDTLQIAQSGAPNYALYDSGKSATDPDYYPWFYIVDATESVSGDYNIAWSYKGFHAAKDENYWGMMDMSKDGIYPKIYLGADFTTAVGSSTYRANIKVELFNE